VGTQPHHRGEKRGNWHHNKNPAKRNISRIPLSEENCWSSRTKKKKKNKKNPTTGAQGIKTLTQNSSRCINTTQNETTRQRDPEQDD
jgi:hypothetical protein